MMKDPRRTARINIKAVVLLLLITLLLGVGAVAAHYVRKGIIADRALAEGMKALEREDWPGACKYLKRYLSKYPDNADVLERYGQAQLSVRPRLAGNIGAAIGAYRRLLRHRSGDAEICRTLAKLYFGIGEYGETVYVCRQRLAVDANDADALLWLGRSLAVQQKRDRAMETLTRLVTVHPDQVTGYVLLSTLAVQRDVATGIKDAAKWLDQAVAKNPRSVEALARRARFYRLAVRDEASARRDLEAVKSLSTDDPWSLLLVADEWMEWGEFDLAKSYLELVDRVDPAVVKRRDIDPDVLAFAKFTGWAQLALKNPDDSRGGTLADAALASLAKPQRLRFLPMAVKLYLHVGRTDDASQRLKELQSALENRTVDRKAREELDVLAAQVASANKQYYEAINHLVSQGDPRRQSAQALRALVDGFYATGQSGRAREALRQYVKKVPQDWQALIQLAQAHRYRDWQQVLNYANAAWRARPTLGAKLLVLEARTMMATGQRNEDRALERILEELTELRDQFPQNVRIRVLMAGVMSQQGRLEAATLELNDAVTTCPDPLPAELMLVDLYSRNDQSSRAREMCEEIITKHPDVSAPRVRLAELQLAADRKKEARQTLEEAMKVLNGDARDAVVQVFVRFLLEQKERSAAVELLEKMAAEQPDNVKVRLSLLTIPEVRADVDKAQRVIDEIAALEGKGGIRWKLQQARLWLESKDWRAQGEKAQALLRDCLAADPGWEAPVLVLGRLLQATGRIREAEKTYRTILAQFPDSLGVADRLVELLKRQSRYVEAQEVLDSVPHTTASLSAHRIDLAIGRGDYEQALQGLELFVAAHPSDVEARVRLARMVYVVKKDRARSLKLLEEARSSAPDSISVLFARVSILLAEGSRDEAITLLNREVKRLNNFSVYWLRATYFTAIKEFALAEQDYIHLTTLEDSAPAGYGLLGDFYYTRGRPDEAISVWEGGLEIYPGYVTLRRALTKGLVASKDPALRARGRAMLEELKKQFPDDPELLRIEAVLLLKDHKADSIARAIEDLENAVAINPGLVACHQMLIGLARRQGDLQRARTLVSRALAMNPAQMDLQVSRIGVELELGNVSVARELGKVLLEDHPSDLLACNQLAELFQQNHDGRFARVCNQQALEIAPDDETANVARATILVTAGEGDKAREHLEAYVQTGAGRKSVAALSALASRLTDEGKFKSADDLLARARDLAPKNIFITVERLRWLAKQNRFDEVEQLLAKQDPTKEDDLAAVMTAADLLASTKRNRYLVLAQHTYQQVCEADPSNTAAHLGFSQVSYQLGKVDVAIDGLRKVLTFNPTQRFALNNLAWMLASHKGTEGLREAEALVERGVARYPNDAHLLDTYGVVMLKLGKLQKARERFDQCVQLAEHEEGTRAKALLHRAQVLVEMKSDPDLIRAGLEEAQAIDRTNSVLSDEERDELARLLQSL